MSDVRELLGQHTWYAGGEKVAVAVAESRRPLCRSSPYVRVVDKTRISKTRTDQDQESRLAVSQMRLQRGGARHHTSALSGRTITKSLVICA